MTSCIIDISEESLANESLARICIHQGDIKLQGLISRWCNNETVRKKRKIRGKRAANLIPHLQLPLREEDCVGLQGV